MGQMEAFAIIAACVCEGKKSSDTRARENETITRLSVRVQERQNERKKTRARERESERGKARNKEGEREGES